jgi:hypothetical protein
MSNFSNDADLLAYEPYVFTDLPFASQRRLRVTDAAVDGTTVTSETGGFAALVAGQVVVIEALTYAIASITDDNTLELAAAPIELSSTTGLTLTVPTLAPQAWLVHDEDDAEADITEQSIVSTQLMRRLEAIGTLAHAYSAAVALVGDNETINAKADRYRQRYQRALNVAQVLIDADGDGLADAWRSPGVGWMVRA